MYYQALKEQNPDSFDGDHCTSKSLTAVLMSRMNQFDDTVDTQVLEQTDLVQREEGPQIADDSETIEPVEIKDAPKFNKTSELRNWLVGIFESVNTVVIDSTGNKVDFSKNDAKRVIKNARKRENNLAYKEIKQVVKRAKYSGFRKADSKHTTVQGQDVYHSAILVNGVPYSVEFYVDLPIDKAGKNSFAGNKVSKIEIGLAATQNQSAAQTSPITTISLGVLRQKVKPARYKDGTLFQRTQANGYYDAELKVIVLGRNMNTMTLPHEMAHFWLDNTFSMFKKASKGELTIGQQWIDETNTLFGILGIDPQQDPGRVQVWKNLCLSDI